MIVWEPIRILGSSPAWQIGIQFFNKILGVGGVGGQTEPQDLILHSISLEDFGTVYDEDARWCLSKPCIFSSHFPAVL